MIEIGDKIDDRYRITSRIAHGGMADVYEAYDLAMRRITALKVMREDMMGDPKNSIAASMSLNSMVLAWLMAVLIWQTNMSKDGRCVTN